MNTDCTKPSVAPKPRFVCHASLNLPTPLMTANRGPKPSLAPKPRVIPELNGNQDRCINGGPLISDGEVEEEHETENSFDKMVADRVPAEAQLNDDTLKASLKDGRNVIYGTDDRNVTEEEREEEEDMIQKMDEDWRLTDSALTDNVDSLETLWVSDAGLTADSEESVEMADTTEEMDAEGCDAGEALADTDGLSMGDISVSDEMAGCRFAEKRHKNGQNKLQSKANEVGDCTADDFSESLTDEPGLTNTHFILTDRPDTDEESAADCGHMCNKLKVSCETTGKGKTLENIHCYDPKHQKCSDDPAHEPYYVSSDDVINIEIMSRDNTESPLRPQKVPSLNRWEETARKCEELTDNGKSSEQYMEINKNGSNFSKSDTNEVGPYQKWVTVQTEELCPQTAAVLLNRLDCQPRVRVVSISVPADADTSLTSSLSESQLFSPNNSDISDLEGHIMPFLDDTTDTEQDISDDHVYEEPSLEGQDVFPFDKRSREIHSCSLSQHLNNNVAEVGSRFSQRPYMSGYEQPSLSSTPILTSKQKNYAKPLYLSRYPRSISVEGQDTSVGVYSYMEGSPKQGGAICLPGSFSRCSPLSSSGLSTPTSVVDIPPPFELAYITKRPITKSSPSLFTEEDSSAKNRKTKSSIKRFLMLKFRRKTDSKSMVDVKASSFKSSAESVHRTPSRLLDPDRQNINNSPQLNSRSAKPHVSLAPSSKFLLYDDIKSKGSSAAFLNRSIIRVESFEDRSRAPFTPLPLIKPRSISFPNTDTSDYENVPPLSSDYENVQVPQRRPVLQVPFTDFFDRPSRLLSSTNETDGYVDMSSLPGFKGKTQSPDQETESAYTEPYKVCLVAATPQATSAGEVREEMAGEEDQGCTSEEEEEGVSSNYERQPDGRSRAFYIAKELVDTEREHVKALKLLQEDFREAVGAGVGDEGEPVLDEERLREILNELPDVYTLHRRILNELENRIRHWDENQRIADVFLSRKAEFLVFTTYIGHYDRSMSLLEDSCRTSPAFAAIVHQFEQIENVPLKHQLLQVIVRVAQYRMFLTDYLNNLSPDSREYEDTQAAVAAVSDVAEQANDSLKHGENLLRLVNIEYSVHGQRDLLQPGRVFVKEGTLMKVSRKSRQPRHLFLTEPLRAGSPSGMYPQAHFPCQFFADTTGKMNDVLLYTFPQQDGKYRLKNSFPLTGLKVSKPIIENVQNALKIEGTDISITLSASSFIEREDWFYTLSRTVTEHTQGSGAFNSCSGEPRDHLHFSLGEKAPKLVPVSQVMMCMNCTSDFSLTLRRHHCHGCGRIVCRSCSRNRYPLKYMKDRMAKVCDHCYNELTKRGGDVPALSSQSSPHQRRSNRPLSAVFQNIHPPNIWRHRKGTLSFTQVTISEEGSISGSLHRSKKSKKSWKRLWFLLKDKVLYTYRAQEEKVASETLPLLGFTVKLPDRLEGEEGKEDNIFQLYHKKTLYYTFKAADNNTAQRWVNAMEEATVL